MFGLSLRVTNHARLITWQALFILFLLISTVSCAGLASTKYEKEAAPVAEEFLKLIDDGNYQGALDKITVQSANGPPSTTDPLRALRWKIMNQRAPMGKPLERIYWGAMNKIFIPGKPDGEYLDVHYRTKFENKEYASEGVLLLKKDGAWVVTDYAIF